MEGLAEIKKQEEDSDQMYRKGMPVLDSTHNGVCYCAVGECDCDGSIWNQKFGKLNRDGFTLGRFSLWAKRPIK